jgi:hypothetical protein
MTLRRDDVALPAHHLVPTHSVSQPWSGLPLPGRGRSAEITLLGIG